MFTKLGLENMLNIHNIFILIIKVNCNNFDKFDSFIDSLILLVWMNQLKHSFNNWK